MTLQRSPAGSTGRGCPWTAATAICLAWMALLALVMSRLKANNGMLVAILAALPVVCTFMVCAWNHHKPKNLRCHLADVTVKVHAEQAAGATFFVTLPRGTTAPANSDAPSDSGDSLKLRGGLHLGGSGSAG